MKQDDKIIKMPVQDEVKEEEMTDLQKFIKEHEQKVQETFKNK